MSSDLDVDIRGESKLVYIGTVVYLLWSGIGSSTYTRPRPRCLKFEDKLEVEPPEVSSTSSSEEITDVILPSLASRLSRFQETGIRCVHKVVRLDCAMLSYLERFLPSVVWDRVHCLIHAPDHAV